VTAGRLVDCGLIARYFLDEAERGTAPRAALDAAPDPLDLPLSYVGGAGYAEQLGQRGLAFPLAGEDGGAFRAAGGTKMFAFQGSSTGTMEAVLDYELVTYLGTRIVQLGHDSAAVFSLAATYDWAMGDPTIDLPKRVQIRTLLAGKTEETVGNFDLALHELGRVVIHGVLDTNATDVTDRMRLYVNGLRVDLAGYRDDVEPALGATLQLGAQDSIGLANRAIGGRSPQGTLYYGAYYDVALDEAQLAHNAGLLLDDDDTPATTTTP
jgi:hypothetical protein